MVGEPLTVRTLLDRALAAYSALADLGEQIEDEWSYVNDLRVAWVERLELAAEARGDQVATSEQVQAIETAAAETGLIADPNRAIDWLSTFPQIVLLTLGQGS